MSILVSGPDEKILMCEGRCGRPTRHVFRRKDWAEDIEDPFMVLQYHIYTCDECDEERIFGASDVEAQ